MTGSARDYPPLPKLSPTLNRSCWKDQLHGLPSTHEIVEKNRATSGAREITRGSVIVSGNRNSLTFKPASLQRKLLGLVFYFITTPLTNRKHP